MTGPHFVAVPDPGDRMRLRSGGPELVVLELSDTQGALCAWLLDDGQRMQDWFQLATLERVPAWVVREATD